jgi:hypothetical protein
MTVKMRYIKDLPKRAGLYIQGIGVISIKVMIKIMKFFHHDLDHYENKKNVTQKHHIEDLEGIFFSIEFLKNNHV